MTPVRPTEIEPTKPIISIKSLIPIRNKTNGGSKTNKCDFLLLVPRSYSNDSPSAIDVLIKTVKVEKDPKRAPTKIITGPRKLLNPDIASGEVTSPEIPKTVKEKTRYKTAGTIDPHQMAFFRSFSLPLVISLAKGIDDMPANEKRITPNGRNQNSFMKTVEKLFKSILPAPNMAIIKITTVKNKITAKSTLDTVLRPFKYTTAATAKNKMLNM